MIIKKGDIVGRNSYNSDILFKIDKILETNKGKIALLKGLMIRIEADAPIEDLKLINKDTVRKNIKNFENIIINKIDNLKKENRFDYIKVTTGKILHLDGDKKYSEKAKTYYKKMGLNAIVKNIPEYKQTKMIRELIKKYNPDILVITGHDAMIKKGTRYNDINNYRNSKYFINSVIEARRIVPKEKDLVIFAGACQSFFEAIMEAGANFASSPARVLIDFVDPLIVAEKIATTEEKKFISMREITNELEDEMKRVGGKGARGKMKFNFSM